MELDTATGCNVDMHTAQSPRYPPTLMVTDVYEHTGRPHHRRRRYLPLAACREGGGFHTHSCCSLGRTRPCRRLAPSQACTSPAWNVASPTSYGPQIDPSKLAGLNEKSSKETLADLAFQTKNDEFS
jgi:hypothetical protein